MKIDATIKADTLPVCSTSHSHIRLMNDNRWPWIIILPVDSQSTELHQLKRTQREGFLSDINRCSEIVQKQTQCRSVNIAMLGNMVSALHCHVVARDVGDPNWPKPVWGFEKKRVYDGEIPDQLIKAIQQELLE